MDQLAGTAVVALTPEMSCKDAAERLATAADGRAVVVDEDNRPIGVIALAACVTAPDSATVGSTMSRDLAVATISDNAERALVDMLNANHACLILVDRDGRLSGIVTEAAALRFLVQTIEAEADRFSGVEHSRDRKYVDLSVLSDFRRRAPWVLALAVVGLAAGYVVHIYEEALDALVILALYMPMVADTGGNVGTQSASLITRALVVGDLGTRDVGRILWRESRVALLLASMLFIFAFLKVTLLSNNADVPGGLDLFSIAIAISVAISTQVFVATILGAILPLGAIAIRQDPAVVAGPALTTIVDCSGLVLYFTITTALLDLPLPTL